MGMQMMMIRMFAGMFGGGGGGGTETSGATETAGTPTKSSAEISAEILKMESEKAKLDGQYSDLQKQYDFGSEEAKKALDEDAKKIFGAKDMNDISSSNDKLSKEQKYASELSRIHNEILTKQQAVEANNGVITNNTNKIGTLTSNIESLGADIKRMTNLIASNNAAIENMPEDQQASLKAQNAQLKIDIQKADTEKTQKEQEKKDLVKNNKDKKQANDKLTVEISTLEESKSNISEPPNNAGDIKANVEGFESRKQLYNQYKDRLETIKADMKKIEDQINALNKKIESANAARDEAIDAEAALARAESEKMNSAKEFAYYDNNDSTAWGRGIFGSRSRKAKKALKELNVGKDAAADKCGGSSEAKAYYVKAVAADNWNEFKGYKNDTSGLTLSRERYNSIVENIGYKDLRAGATLGSDGKYNLTGLDITNKIKKALTDAGYYSS